MKIEWQKKLQHFIEDIGNLTDDELYSEDITNDLVRSARIQKINLHKNQLSVEIGEQFFGFTDSDIPPGLIIPLNGKMFEYALYKVPFDGNMEAAQRLLKDLGSPKYQSISDNQFKIVMYYSDKIRNNPAVEERIKLIAQDSINRFERACIDYNSEAETFNKIMESTLKRNVESEKQKRKN